MVAGCGSDDSGAGSAKTQCNEIAADLSLVEEQKKAESAPKPLGGIFEEGLYVATAYTQYTGTGGATGPTGESHRFALRVFELTLSMGQHGKYEWLHDDYREAGTFFNNGSSSFATEQTCPPPESGAYIVPSFSVVGNDILYFVSPKSVVTLTRQ